MKKLSAIILLCLPLSVSAQFSLKNLGKSVVGTAVETVSNQSVIKKNQELVNDVPAASAAYVNSVKWGAVSNYVTVADSWVGPIWEGESTSATPLFFFKKNPIVIWIDKTPIKRPSFLKTLRQYPFVQKYPVSYLEENGIKTYLLMDSEGNIQYLSVLY